MHGDTSPTDVSYIQGYLYKKTRDGRWQKRWFETTGSFLTYYKTKKMTKLLAALNLPQVGAIRLMPEVFVEDPHDIGCLFTIHINDRDYVLKAADPASAQRWVDVLNVLREGDKPVDAKPLPDDSARVEKPTGFWHKALRWAKCTCLRRPSPTLAAGCCCIKANKTIPK